MKFSLFCSLIFLVAAALFIPHASAQVALNPDPIGVVDIPDPNLKGAITEELELPANTPITQQQMARLRSLDAVEREIGDLTGLEYATNLYRLKAWRNQIKDLTPLANLTKLERLALWGNQIKDVTPLANLTKLTELDLAYNAVESVEPIAGLINLYRLNLTSNRVQDITPLANLVNLQKLYIRDNLVTDITPLANLTNLTELTVSRNQVRDLKPLTRLTALTSLHLSDNRISELTPLMNLTALETLRLNMNAIVDITPLIGLKNLKELWFADNPIGDFTPLAQLEGVELDVEVDFSRLDKLHLVVEVPDSNLRQAIREALSLPDEIPLTQLEMLRLQRLKAWQLDITDLTGLQHAANVEYLILWGNQITDLSPLANLTKLTELNLAYNPVESVEPIAGLINLQTLNLTENRVQDITPLANLINLEFLYIRDNLVTDITPLQGLNLIDFDYEEVCDFPPIGPPVRDKIESRTFPSVFAWRGHLSLVGLDHLTPDQRVARHDLDLGLWFKVGWDQTPTEPAEGLATSMAGNLPGSREIHQKRLDLNPNLITLRGISHITSLKLPLDSDLYVRDENGEIVRTDEGGALVNFLKPEVQDLIAKRIIAVARCGLFDGVHLDSWGNGVKLRFRIRRLFRPPPEDILQARLNILRTVREQVRDDFLIVVNVGALKIPHYVDYINGVFMETGRDTPLGYSRNELIERVESTLLWSEKNLREPRANCLMGTGIPTEPPDSPRNRRMMRIITTLSLTHSDGYVKYTTGTNHQHIWYDFWDADLGRPIGPKAQQYQNIEGLFIREFTNGWAVYNRSGEPQTITLLTSATPVSDRENNAASQTHLLPDLDGEIYLKGPSPADVNADGKVDVLDLLQVANSLGESTPDPNGDGVVDILDLAFVSQQFSQ